MGSYETGAASASRVGEAAKRAIDLIASDIPEAERLAREAYEASKTSGERWEAEKAAYALGSLLVVRGLYPEAIRFVHEAFDEQRRRHGRSAMPAAYLNIIGTSYRHLGLYELALEYLLRAKQEMAPEDPAALGLFNNLGLALFEIGEYARCIPYFSRALAAFELEGYARVANLVRANIGDALIELGESAEALAVFADTIEKAELLGDPFAKGFALACIARVRRAAGDPVEVELAFAEAERLIEAGGGAHEGLQVRLDFAEALLEWGRPEEALARFQTALAGAESLGAREELARARLGLARTLEPLGRWEEAAAAYRSFVEMGVSLAGRERGRQAFRDRLLEEERDRALGLELEIGRQAEDLLRFQEVVIESLTSLAELRDDDTGEHIRRTTRFVELLAFGLAERGLRGLDAETARLYTATSALHDIGKVGISDAILRKAGPLSAEERAEMKRHAVIGEGVVRRADWGSADPAYAEAAAEIIGCHHEHWDGSGYPRGLQGERIPLGGRIMAVADVYDAIRSRRPYKEAMDHEEAVDFIRSRSGSLFDPLVVQVFLDRAEEFREAYGPKPPRPSTGP